jgi:hypothetical protein
MTDALSRNNSEQMWPHCAIAFVALLLITARPAPASGAKPSNTVDGKPYSLPTSTVIPQRVLWGDTHLHTGISIDAGLIGTTLMPEDAYRFARGEEIISNSGVPAKLRRPYDFLCVTDHAEYMGLPEVLVKGSPALLSDPAGKRWYDAMHGTAEDRAIIFQEFAQSQLDRKPVVTVPGLAQSTWEREIAAAEKYNEPGKFTAFIAFEWSAQPGGDNLHRNVIFRDGADKASQILPLSAFDTSDPEQLWRYLADYEHKTGGRVLAIPHNSDLSGGLMFADRTLGGKRLDRAYAEQRAKWETVAEVTQSKGDSETDPSVSPDDEFANFERWDKFNVQMLKEDKPEDQPFNYLRPSLTRGLKWEQELGINPFKLGLIGSTDIHTGLSTTEPDNYFGASPQAEPGPGRVHAKAIKANARSKATFNPLELSSAGLAAVWASENTRQAIFDALRRREVYATTGTRITVRVFAGWDFKPGDSARSDFAEYGYAHGVAMGGDLSGARAGQRPVFAIQAAKDPDGANLDRIQVIKGWLDAKGATHEKIYDVAWSGDRKPGPNGKFPSVGNTVDIGRATYSNSIGAPVLDTVWTDPDFKAEERALYYLRVIEIPTPRWTTYDSVRFGTQLPESVPAVLTQRAYTSPVWYTPSKHG